MSIGIKKFLLWSGFVGFRGGRWVVFGGDCAEKSAFHAFGDILFASSGKKYAKNAAKTKVLESFARPAHFGLF